MTVANFYVRYLVLLSTIKFQPPTTWHSGDSVVCLVMSGSYQSIDNALLCGFGGFQYYYFSLWWHTFLAIIILFKKKIAWSGSVKCNLTPCTSVQCTFLNFTMIGKVILEIWLFLKSIFIYLGIIENRT